MNRAQLRQLEAMHRAGELPAPNERLVGTEWVAYHAVTGAVLSRRPAGPKAIAAAAQEAK